MLLETIIGKITGEEQDNSINSDVFSNKVQPDFSNNDTIQLLKAGSWIIKRSNELTNQQPGSRKMRKFKKGQLCTAFFFPL